MKRTGGIAKPGHREKPKEGGNVYCPPDVALHIAEYLKPHYENLSWPIIFDECANDGILGKSFHEFSNGGSWFRHDIKFDGVPGQFFKIKRADIIICNPPWREETAREIFFKLKKDLHRPGVLFYLINNVFMYQGHKRARELGCQKFYFLPRYVFKSAGRPLLDCGIAVYHNWQMPIDAAMLPCYIPIKPGENNG